MKLKYAGQDVGTGGWAEGESPIVVRSEICECEVFRFENKMWICICFRDI